MTSHVLHGKSQELPNVGRRSALRDGLGGVVGVLQVLGDVEFVVLRVRYNRNDAILHKPGLKLRISHLILVLGALNLFIRPLLIILTLPINILTLGLFSIVINALLVWFTATVVPGFVVPSFGSALLFALILTIINWVFISWQY